MKSRENEADILFSKTFDENKDKDFLLTEISFKNIYSFNLVYKPTTFINLILGKNGNMKTEFLRILTSFIYPKFFVEQINEIRKQNENNEISFVKGQMYNGNSFEKILSNDSNILEEKPINLLPFSILVIPDDRFIDKNVEDIQDNSTSKLDILSETLEKFIKKETFGEKSIQYLFRQIAEEVYFTQKNRTYEIKFNDFKKQESYHNSLTKLIEDVLNELLKDDDNDENWTFQFDFLKIEDNGDRKYKIYVKTDVNPDVSIPIQWISRGTLSVLSIFGLIHCYLQEKYRPSKLENLKEKYPYPEKTLHEQPAVVFIDEIDAHLHPTFQKKIVKLLRDYFPCIQFFIVAHNPLTVKGCDKGEIAVMRKENDKIVLEQYQKSTIGDSSSNILRELFESDDIDNTFIELLAMGTKKEQAANKHK